MKRFKTELEKDIDDIFTITYDDNGDEIYTIIINNISSSFLEKIKQPSKNVKQELRRRKIKNILINN